MATTLKKWLGMVVPGGWDDVFVRTVKAAVVAFVALLLKEALESSEWDVPACVVDAAWVAGGAFVLNAILTWRALSEAPPQTHEAEPRVNR